MSDQFMKSINLFIDKANADIETVVRKTSIQILARLVDMSPVGNPDIWKSKYSPPGYAGGRFKGNWQVTFDSPADGEIENIDKAGNITKSQGNVVIEHFKIGMNAIYFTNNVPYAYRLEMGHSKQAPSGMVAVTAEEFSQFFNSAVSETKS